MDQYSDHGQNTTTPISRTKLLRTKSGPLAAPGSRSAPQPAPTYNTIAGASIEISLGRTLDGQRRLEHLLYDLIKSKKTNLQDSSDGRSSERDHNDAQIPNYQRSVTPMRAISTREEQSPNKKSSRTFMFELEPRLSPSWPDCLQAVEGLHELSSSTVEPDRERHVVPLLSSSTGITPLDDNLGSTGKGHFLSSYMCDSWVLDPNSAWRCWYDAAAILMLGFDVVVMPYILAWNVSLDLFLSACGWVTNCFWLCDVLLNCTTGYYNHGTLVMSRRSILKKYFKTGFTFDMSLVVVSFLSLTDDTTVGLSVLRLFKLARLFRIVALVKLMKNGSIVEKFALRYMLRYEYSLCMLLIQVVIGTLLFSHLSTCVWYWLGTAGPTDTGWRWTSFIGTDGPAPRPFMDEGILYQYSTTFHWCFAAIALNGIEIPCTNTCERAVNIVWIMGGILYASSLVSILSTATVEFSRVRQRRNDILRELTHYLVEHRVDRHMIRTIKWQVTSRFKERNIVTEDTCEALRWISRSLFDQVKIQTRIDHLACCPFFLIMRTFEYQRVNLLCSSGIDFILAREGDDVFTCNRRAKGSYYLVKGSSLYSQSPVYSRVLEPVAIAVGERAWISEVALWVDWFHVGNLAGVELTHALLIQTEAFVEMVVSTDGPVRVICNHYAAHFLRAVRHAKPPLQWANDLYVPFSEYEILVLSMDAASKTQVGAAALAHAGSWAISGKRSRDVLSAEIAEGKSVVILTPQRQLRRISYVVSLRLTSDDKRMLAELGSLEGSDVKVSGRLPGSKPNPGEMAMDTLDRIIRTSFPMLLDLYDVTRHERLDTTSFSAKLGVSTNYIRSVFDVALKHGLEFESFAKHQSGLDGIPVGLCTGQAGLNWLMGRSVGLQASRAEVIEVFTISTERSVRFYAWLTDEELASFSTKQGEQALHDLLLTAWKPASVTL